MLLSTAIITSPLLVVVALCSLLARVCVCALRDFGHGAGHGLLVVFCVALSSYSQKFDPSVLSTKE
jgi:hypothetical protein